MNSLYISLHILSVVVWVGGMVFAHRFLRPVIAAQLEPPQRLRLWVGIFSNFFPFVWGAIILLPLTGYTMIFGIWQSMAALPLHIHIMNGLGSLMIVIFLYVYFLPFAQLKNAVNSENWPAGGEALNKIRSLVGINTLLGLLVIVIAAAGRYWVY